MGIAGDAFDAPHLWPLRTRTAPPGCYTPLVSEAAWTTVYRTMLADPADDLPACGSEPSMLGVRPRTDVRLREDGTVDLERNKARGLSVAPRPQDLVPAHRPLGLRGGQSVLPCWALDATRVDAATDHLQVVPTSATHGAVATTEDIHIDEFQRRLCVTKERWTPWKPPTT